MKTSRFSNVTVLIMVVVFLLSFGKEAFASFWIRQSTEPAGAWGAEFTPDMTSSGWGYGDGFGYGTDGAGYYGGYTKGQTFNDNSTGGLHSAPPADPPVYQSGNGWGYMDIDMPYNIATESYQATPNFLTFPNRMARMVQAGFVYPVPYVGHDSNEYGIANINQINFLATTTLNLDASSKAVIDSGTTFTATSDIDFNAFTSSLVVDVSGLNAGLTSIGAMQLGVPTASLSTSKPVHLVVSVAPGHNTETLSIYHKVPGGSWALFGTCVIAANICNFNATSFSDFSVTTGVPSIVLPTVSTAVATSTTAVSVSLPGSITVTGGENASSRGFAYGTTAVYTATSTEAGSFGVGDFYSTVSGLSCGTTYHYVAWAANSAGFSYGSDKTFTSDACSTISTVTTDSANSINQTSFSANGTITATGGPGATVRGFAYGLTSAYDATTTENGAFGVGSFTATISSLSCNTTYHIRAYAINAVGTGYGADVVAMTSACSSAGGGSPMGNGPVPPLVFSPEGKVVPKPLVVSAVSVSVPPPAIIESNQGQPLAVNNVAGNGGPCGEYLKKYIRFGRANDPVEVLKLQLYLNRRENLPDVPVSGIYDRVTMDAASQFQVRNKKEVLEEAWGISDPTGYVFISTKAKINKLYCNDTSSISLDLRNYYPQVPISRTLAIGSEGSQVRELQVRLMKLGFYSGIISGVYGKATTKAVREYQLAHNIAQTGKVGPITRKTLDSEDYTSSITIGENRTTMQ